MSAETEQQQRKRPRKRSKQRRLGREERSLSCLVQALEGRKLVVELRNDLIVRGTLDEADEFMNLSMSQVSTQDVQGRKMQMEYLYVRGRNIRFVHLPKSLDPAAAVEQQRQKLIQLRIDAFKARQQQMQAASSIAKGDGGAAYEIQDLAVYRPSPPPREEHLIVQQQGQQHGLHTQSANQRQTGLLAEQGPSLQPPYQSSGLHQRQYQTRIDQASKMEPTVAPAGHQQQSNQGPFVISGSQQPQGHDTNVTGEVHQLALITSQQADIMQGTTGTTTTTTKTVITAVATTSETNVVEEVEDAIGDDELLAGMDIYDTGIDIEEYSDEEEINEADNQVVDVGMQQPDGGQQTPASPVGDAALQPSASVQPTDAEQDFGDFDFE